jgi:hypothetical protein
VLRHSCVDLLWISDVALAVTEAEYIKVWRCCPEKLDSELSRGPRDKRAHYSLRIWVR